MTLVAIVGNLGEGKTLTQTYLLFKKWTEGRDVYSNYKLEFDFIPVDNIEDIEAMSQGVFGGDELWSWLDSRTSKNGKNRAIASILLKSRKRGIDIYYTTQTFMQMDKRVRSITDFIVTPQMNRLKTVCTAYWYNKNDVSFSNNPIPISRTRFLTKPIFPLYDTNEEVKILE